MGSGGGGGVWVEWMDLLARMHKVAANDLIHVIFGLVVLDIKPRPAPRPADEPETCVCVSGGVVQKGRGGGGGEKKKKK